MSEKQQVMQAMRNLATALDRVEGNVQQHQMWQASYQVIKAFVEEALRPKGLLKPKEKKDGKPKS